MPGCFCFLLLPCRRFTVYMMWFPIVGFMDRVLKTMTLYNLQHTDTMNLQPVYCLFFEDKLQVDFTLAFSASDALSRPASSVNTSSHSPSSST